ncbi:MAG: PDZ domain-containing protein [Candidatus Aminicenantes bacterium]|nr:MAG: PDZ domain-containing protein [Candidatus Aminicenantes bacterium]
MKKLNNFVFLIAVTVALFLIFGGTKIFQSHPEAKEEYDYLSLISEVVSLVKMEYVEEVQPEKKFPGGFSRMLRSLDKFSTYLDAPKTKIYRLYQQGKTYNCGIYGTKQSNYFYITDIVPNSPAQKHGLKPGDTIKAINGESIFGQSFWEMVLSLHTDKPETIELILLQNQNKPGKPNKIKLKTTSVNTDLKIKNIDANILVELPRIDATNAAHLEQKLENELSHTNPLKLIIDLRKYSGGDIDAFIQLTRVFFPRSIPLTIKTKHKEEKFLLGSSHPLAYQAVVIINKSTRMYGELLAALFKEYGKDRAILVGVKTRGFISKIKQFSLYDGSSILLTEGFFLLNGKNPADTGVTPDVKINETDPDKIIDRAVFILKKTYDQD